MNLKGARSWWPAGLLLISTLGMGIAIYLATSRPVGEASAPKPIGHELDDNAANGLDAPPAAGATAPTPTDPLAFLLSHRRRRASAEHINLNAPIDLNEPARTVTEKPSDTAAPGTASQVGLAEAHHLATETGPRGIPVPAANLKPNSEALRNNTSPTAPTLR